MNVCNWINTILECDWCLENLSNENMNYLEMNLVYDGKLMVGCGNVLEDELEFWNEWNLALKWFNNE